jgi:ribose 1,5-bisphosphokinase PhnN
MEHPAGKDKIVKRAEQNGADENALDVLRRIPDRQCDGSNVDSHEINGAN